MTDRELIQQALYALEQVAKYFNADSTELKTIAALRERLSKPDSAAYWRSEFLKNNTTSDHRLMEPPPEFIDALKFDVAKRDSEAQQAYEDAFVNGTRHHRRTEMKRTDIIKATANSLNIYWFTAEALERLIEAVKAEQSCPTCEALARTVMLDQTSHDAQRKPWIGLTDQEIRDWWRIENGLEDCQLSKLVDFTLAVRAIEAKLKEKNA